MKVNLRIGYILAVLLAGVLPIAAQNITAEKLESASRISGYNPVRDEPRLTEKTTNEFFKLTSGERNKRATDALSDPQSAGNGQQTYVRPNPGKRFKKYINSVVGPTAFIGPVISAGINQARDRPEEWENNAKGFTRRFGSAVGKNAIRQTVTYGLDEAFKLDSNFYKSGKKKFGDRLGNALLSSVTARNKDGKRVVGVPSIVGAYSASVIAVETWYPKRFDYKEGLRQGTISIFTRMGINVMREFLFK